MTGCGTQRRELIRKFHVQSDIIYRVYSLVKKVPHKITGIMSRRDNNIESVIERLYAEYKFDDEGRDRWWLRAIFQKE